MGSFLSRKKPSDLFSVISKLNRILNNLDFISLARGTDVEKYVAMGANCTLAGRHFVRAAHGGLADGVALFANKMKNELAVAMVLTGAQTVKDINRSMVVIPDYKA